MLALSRVCLANRLTYVMFVNNIKRSSLTSLILACPKSIELRVNFDFDDVLLFCRRCELSSIRLDSYL